MHIVNIKDPNNDNHFWMKKTHQERLDAMEFLRDQYIKTLPYAQQRFQRICRIINCK